MSFVRSKGVEYKFLGIDLYRCKLLLLRQLLMTISLISLSLSDGFVRSLDRWWELFSPSASCYWFIPIFLIFFRASSVLNYPAPLKKGSCCWCKFFNGLALSSFNPIIVNWHPSSFCPSSIFGGFFKKNELVELAWCYIQQASKRQGLRSHWSRAWSTIVNSAALQSRNLCHRLLTSLEHPKLVRPW